MAKAIVLNNPVQKAQEQESKRLFIGRAWYNTSSKNPGVTYTNIMFDRDVEVTIKDLKNNVAYVLSGKEGMFAYPNTKRDGKKDADLRVSISTE